MCYFAGYCYIVYERDDVFCGNSFVSWPSIIMACTLNIKFLEYKLVLTWKSSTDCDQVLIVKKGKPFIFQFLRVT